MADINQTAPWVTARLTELGNATNDGLNTLVTSANIGTYDAGNVSGVVAIEHGGTGANNAADAITNLGAITTSDVSTVGKTGEYDDLLNKPTIPTISQTYNASSSDGMSGAAVAQGIAAETTRATAAESSLQSAITAEETRAKAAETTLTNNLSTERTQRIQAVQGLSSGLDTANQNISVLQTDLETNTETLAENFADEYSATSTYSAGDYVIYNNGLYQASQDITTAESWEPGHWTRTTVSAIKGEIEAELAEQTAGSYPTVTTSGPIASFPDGADNIPMKSVIAHIEPVQAGSGDPSPDNVRAISGWTAANISRMGKNMIAPYAASQTKNGITFTVNPDNSITASGTATATTVLYLSAYSDIWKEGQFVLSGCPNSGGNGKYALRMYGSGTVTYASDFGAGVTFTGKAQLECAIVVWDNQTLENVIFQPMIRPASDTDPTFEPYTGATYPITFDSAGTVYGGYVDVTNGELVVTHKKRAISEGGWTHNTQYDFYYTNTIMDRKMGSSVVASCYKYIGVLGDGSMGSVETGSIAIGSSSTRTVKIKDTRYPTTADFIQSDGYFIYELATPITYQLTPTQITTLLGQNNIWCDTGDIEVEYRADPTLYIDGQITPVKGFIASEETGTTASQAYTAGQYFILDGAFCKALVNIALDATFTLGTNYSVTTIGAELYSALHS